jgi:hypothetical protein
VDLELKIIEILSSVTLKHLPCCHVLGASAFTLANNRCSAVSDIFCFFTSDAVMRGVLSTPVKHPESITVRIKFVAIILVVVIRLWMA